MKRQMRLAAAFGLALSLGGLGPVAGLAEDAAVLDPGGGQSGALATMGADSDLGRFLAATGWVNQSGSVMNFTGTSTGQIQGTYVNNATGTGCQGTAYPLIGWVNGNNIAWSVSWSNASADCNSVTAWGGYYDPSTGSIQTRWTLAYQSGSGGAIQQGADVFKYQ
jgi:hypothetical protein